MLLPPTIAVALAVVVLGNVVAGVTRRRPAPLVVAWALTIPVFAYALGTLLTPIFFRPELPEFSRSEYLGGHLIEVAVSLAPVVLLGTLALGSLRSASAARSA